MISGNATNRVGVRPIAGFALAKAGPGILMLIAIPIWVRIFGLAEYGLYSLVWSLSTISGALCSGWIRQSTLRYTGRPKLVPENLPRWVLPTISIVACVPLTLVYFTGLTAIDILVLPFGLLVSMLNVQYVVRQASTQRAGYSFRYAIAETMRVFIALTGSLVMHDLVGIRGAAAILIGYAMATFVGSCLLKGAPRSAMSSSVRNDLLRTFWTYGWPLSLWQGLSNAMNYGDRMLVSLFVGASEAGAYAAIADLVVRGVSMAIFPLTMASHPAIMLRWNGGDFAAAYAINRRYGAILAIYGLIGVAAIGLFGNTVLHLLTGNYPQWPWLPAMLAAGAVFWQMALMVHKPLELAGRTKMMVMALIASLAINLTVNLALLPVTGAPAAAFAFALSALSYVLISGYLSARTKKLVRPHPWST